MIFPFFSVIVPNYNHASFLEQRLDSIFNQSFQNFEVIILDDCSTDNSKEIIEKYRNRKQTSHIIYNVKNSGSPFKQWAKGFELAQGEYIWIAESDDWAELNFLEEFHKNIHNYSDITVAFSAKHVIFPDSTKVKSTYDSNKIENGEKFIHDKMIDDNSVYNASCAIFKRSSLSSISQDYQNFRGCGDWLFWIELCRHGSVFYHAKPLSYFRKHSSSTTLENMSSGRDLIEYWNIFQKLKSWGYVTFFLKLIVAIRYNDYAKNGIKHHPNNENFKKALDLWKLEIPYPIFSRAIIPIGIFLWNIRLKVYY